METLTDLEKLRKKNSLEKASMRNRCMFCLKPVPIHKRFCNMLCEDLYLERSD